MSSDYTIVDITDERRSEYNAAPSSTSGATSSTCSPLTVEQDLHRALLGWASRHDLPLAIADISFDSDNEDSLAIVLGTLAVGSDGDIVPRTREYIVTASYTIEVQVTVEASSEDEATDKASDEFYSLEFYTDCSDVEVTCTQYDHITDIAEQ